jgi:hypothetical protein
MLIHKLIMNLVGKFSSKNETRLNLCGGRFERTGDKCSAAATDGRKVVHVEWTDEHREEYPSLGRDARSADPVDGFRVTIPNRTMEEAVRCLPAKVKNNYKSWIYDSLLLHEHAPREQEKAQEFPIPMETISSTDLDTVTRKDFLPVDAQYPPYRAILERREKMETPVSARFKIDLLIEVLRALKDVAKDDVKDGQSVVVTIDAKNPTTICWLDVESKVEGAKVQAGLCPFTK